MKRVLAFFTFIFLFIFFSRLYSQELTDDPFAGNYELRNSEEIVFSGYSGASYLQARSFTQRVFDYLQFPGIGDSLVGGPFLIPSTDSVGVNRYNFHWFDMDAGNFFGDGSEETVSAWKNPDSTLSLLVSGIDPFSRQWQTKYYSEADSGLMAAKWPKSEFGCIRVMAGNFDKDTPDEFVLAYWSGNLNTLKMFLYDSDSTTNFQVKATAEDQVMYNDFLAVEDYQYPWFDLYVADLNRDGRDEIIITGVEPAGSGWDVFFQVYNYDENASAFVKQGRKIIYQSKTDSDYDSPYPIRIALTAGHFTNKKFMDCVVGVWAVEYTNPFAQDVEQNLIIVRIDSSLTEIGFNRNFDKFLSEPQRALLGLVPGDLNGDGYDYLFLTQWKHMYIFRVQEDLTLEQLYDHYEEYHYPALEAPSSRHHVVIADIDTALAQNTSAPEIIMYEKIWFPWYPWLKTRLSVFEAELDSSGAVLGLNIKAMKDHFIDDGFSPNIMISANLDEDDIHLGNPKRFQKTEIVQPIVVLNAPPIHYDILDSTPYDLCYAYNDNNCQFSSSYQKQSESSVEVSAEVVKSWTTSKTLSGSFSAFNISIGASLSEKYGKNFSKYGSSSRSISIEVGTDAVVDDRIYATLVDYNIWEYPAFAGNKPIGHILVMEPVAVKNQWFPSKSPVATSYMPNHEVGNIFSYKEYPELFYNEDVASLIKGSYGQSFTLDENSSYDWALTFNDFSGSGSSTSNSVSREVSASAGIFGISAGITDTYESSATQTHNISVTQNLSLQVHLDAIDRSIGEDYYTVTPYAYWAKNGALVIDYAVKPELAEPGYPLTWWQTNYDEDPDPAFILPWRYDEEKGLGSPAEKKYQSREIFFTPAEPAPEEEVTITARVQNYSLLATAAPIKVRFYVGNPDSGGTAIIGTNEETEVYTQDIIQPRSSALVSMDWVIPFDLDQFPRIYAVIDPDNEMTEIHEDNNMGFAVLGKSSIGTDIPTTEKKMPIHFELFQNYPNPFNPETRIKYQLPEACRVDITIYNVLGQRVANLVSEYKPAGRYTFKWDASGMASGFYFYRFAAGQFISTKKMLYLK